MKYDWTGNAVGAVEILAFEVSVVGENHNNLRMIDRHLHECFYRLACLNSEVHVKISKVDIGQIETRLSC